MSATESSPKDKDTKPKTVKLQINGSSIEVNAGTSVIEACDKAGINVPRYCYHTDLSIAGVCRMCVVDIEKNPKLQISCNTIATEGMVVRTDTPRVKDAVKSALELHLINHPLDCPICDKAGECKLQDFYQDFGLYQSRMEFDEKNHKAKVVDIGTIVLDAERCILCTRCVRFTAEVTHTHELGIFNRGDRSELRTYDRGPLRNDYTGNLADICPVGALTAKDFRFKQRVWFMDKTPTVCGMCARGCNTVASFNPKTKKVFRVEPRRNPEVNKSWMCDRGRWGYHHVYEGRVEVPRVQLNGVREQRPWHFAFSELKEGISAAPDKVLVALGTYLTNEELVDITQLFQELGVKNFTWLANEAVVDEKKPWDDLLQHRDLSPNAEGLRRTLETQKIAWTKQAEATSKVKQGAFDWVFWLGLEDIRHEHLVPFATAIPSSTKWVVHATNETPMWEKAYWVLPNVSCLEKSGTFVNAQGRWQKLAAALPVQHTARDGYSLTYGLRRGDDREQLEGDRARELFEAVTAKLFDKAGDGAIPSFKKFEPLGVSL